MTVVGTVTPEARALDEALPPGWYVRATETEEGNNPEVEAFPHHPSEYEYGRSPCYVSIVRTGRQVAYSEREGYHRTDDPQWWVYRHCPADAGVPRHDLDVSVGASGGREAASLAAQLAAGASRDDLRTRSEHRRGDDFDLGNWR